MKVNFENLSFDEIEIWQKIADTSFKFIWFEFSDRIVANKVSLSNVEVWFLEERRWIPNPGVPYSKPLGGSKVDSAFHPSEVGKMSTRNFWELSGKSKLPPRSGSSLEAIELHQQKGAVKFFLSNSFDTFFQYFFLSCENTSCRKRCSTTTIFENTPPEFWD